MSIVRASTSILARQIFALIKRQVWRGGTHHAHWFGCEWRSPRVSYGGSLLHA